MSKGISLEESKQPRWLRETVKNVLIVATLALFIIGSLAIAGHLSPAAVGWLAVGLGGGVTLLSLGSEGKKRKYLILLASLTSLSFLGVGVLGGVGILSAQQVGWGVVGTFLSSLFCWGGIETHCEERRFEDQQF